MKHIVWVWLALCATPVWAQDIELIPVTIGEAKEIYSPEIFQKNNEAADKGGVDLNFELRNYYAKGMKGDNAFVLFYNHARAPTCRRDYLIQRVRLSKSSYDRRLTKTSSRDQYLVEVIKINQDKKTKKPDEHRKRYSLGNAFRRDLHADFEIGCGEIPGIAEGDAWPYESSILYRLVQDYAEEPGLYHQVQYDFSTAYSLDMRFDADGIFQVNFPDFVTPF